MRARNVSSLLIFDQMSSLSFASFINTFSGT
jgi:hypothetical protein